MTFDAREYTDDERDLFAPVNKLIAHLSQNPGQPVTLTYDEAEDIVELAASEWGPLEGYKSREDREEPEMTREP